jgi:CheY-like chemotaxis protein
LTKTTDMSKKVLLIDDDTDDREMFCEAIESIAPDFICCTAPNGKKALIELKNTNSALPDLIFLDVNMPIMNGWQRLSALKEQESFKAIPVIMYSTSSNPEDFQNAYKGPGPIIFFSKPSDFKALTRNLELVVFHLNNNSLPLLVGNPPFYELNSVSTGS